MPMMAHEVALGTATAFLMLKDQGFFDGINQAQSALQGFSNNVNSGMSSMEKVSRLTGDIGMSLTRNITTPVVNAGKSIVDAFRSTEHAFIGVQKTLDQQKLADSFGIVLKEGDDIDKKLIPAYNRLDEAIWDMTQETASSYEEIASVMEMAGQLNVALGKNGQGLIDFTKNIIMLNDTTDLVGADAAKTLAQMTNILGTSEEDFGRLGATIVDLGNNTATTEADIVSMAKRIAGAGELVSLTDQDILAIAATLQSVGISAEMGGTAFSKVLKKMQTAAESGYEPIIDLTNKTGKSLHELALMSENESQAFTALASDLDMKKSDLKSMVKWGELLENFAKVSGMTAEQFVNTWRSEPVKVVEAFAKGLGNVDAQGKSTVQMLQDMGFTEVRLSDMLARLALAQDGFTENLVRANDAWTDADALEIEAARRYSETNAQLSQLNESWKELRVELAEFVVPILKVLVDIARGLIDAIKAMPDWLKQTIVNVSALLAVIGPGLLIISRITESIINLKRFLDLFKAFNLVSKLGDIAKGIGGVRDNCHKVGSCMEETAGKIGKVAGGFGKIGSVVGTVIKTISGIALIIGGAVLAVKEFFDMWENGWNILSTILEAIGIALAAIGAVILGAPAAVAAAVAAIIFALSQAAIVIHDNWDAIKKWFGEMVDGIKEQWNNFTEAWHKKVEETKQKFIRLWEDIKDSGGQAIDWIKEKWNAFVEWWQGLGENIKEKWKNLWREIADFFVKIIAKIHSTIASWFDNTFGDNGIVSGIPLIIKTILGGILSAVKDVVLLIEDVITGLFNILVDIFTGNFNKLKEDLKKLWDSIKHFFNDIINIIREIFSTIFSEVGKFLQNIWNNVIEWFENIVSKVKEFFENLKNNIVEKFNQLKEAIFNAFSKVKETVETIINNIKQAFSNFIDNIKKDIEAVKEAVSHIIDFLKDFVQKAVDAVKGFFSGMIETVKNLWDKVTGFVEDIFGKILDFFTTNLQKLWDWIKDFPSKFVEIGKRIIDGLWEGLKSAWEPLKNWFEEKFGWIGDAIDRIKGTFGGIGSAIGDFFNGSHASGLDYVPFDGYIAQLHKGERVLTKQENEEYTRGSNGSSGDTFNFYNTQPDPYEYARQMKRAKKELLYT